MFFIDQLVGLFPIGNTIFMNEQDNKRFVKTLDKKTKICYTY